MDFNCMNLDAFQVIKTTTTCVHSNIIYSHAIRHSIHLKKKNQIIVATAFKYNEKLVTPPPHPAPFLFNATSNQVENGF